MKTEDYINIKELSERLDGDFNLFTELVDLFLEDTQTMLKKIELSIQMKDPEQIRKNAHTLKGSVSNFSAKKAYDAVLVMENVGKQQSLQNAMDAFLVLKNEIQNAIEALIIIKKNNKF